MQVKINDQVHQFKQAQSIQATLEQLNHASNKGIAIAINNEVIPKSKWNDHLLADQDEVLIVTATQGG